MNQSLGAVDHLLKALWQSEYQGRFYLYRLSIILLADMGLELGMTDWSRRLMEEIIPQVRILISLRFKTLTHTYRQVISGDSVELRAFACFVLARCIIACCGKNCMLLLLGQVMFSLPSYRHEALRSSSVPPDIRE